MVYDFLCDVIYAISPWIFFGGIIYAVAWAVHGQQNEDD